MKYFVILLPMKDSDKSRDFRAQHLSFLDKMRSSGTVVANGKFTDGSGGMDIYKADSYENCETLVKMDPYVAEEAREYQIIEWEAVWADNMK